MQLKELLHRSPMRVFERSVHGGLGRGNLGLAISRPGVGKNAFLTGIALDRLLHGEKVLHLALHQTVEHVHERYEEIFKDMAHTANLEDYSEVHETTERNRIIRSLSGTHFTTEAFEESVRVFETHADFHPDLILVSGFDFESETALEDVTAMLERAKALNAELWMPARSGRIEPGDDWHVLPERLARFESLASVIVRLQPAEEAVHIRLLKDHANEEIADLELALDPTSLLVRVG
jgi:hypothetical protein